jgi:hypothetical protein
LLHGLNTVIEEARKAQKIADESAIAGLEEVATNLAAVANGLTAVAEILLEHEDRHHLGKLAGQDSP